MSKKVVRTTVREVDVVNSDGDERTAYYLDLEPLDLAEFDDGDEVVVVLATEREEMQKRIKELEEALIAAVERYDLGPARALGRPVAGGTPDGE